MVNPVHNSLLSEEIAGLKNDIIDNDDIKNNAPFSQFLRENIEQVNNLQKEASQLGRDFALGEIDNVHQVTIATEKASIAMNLTLAIQNKVVDAYKEIMRLQV